MDSQMQSWTDFLCVMELCSWDWSHARKTTHTLNRCGTICKQSNHSPKLWCWYVLPPVEIQMLEPKHKINNRDTINTSCWSIYALSYLSCTFRGAKSKLSRPHIPVRWNSNKYQEVSSEEQSDKYVLHHFYILFITFIIFCVHIYYILCYHIYPKTHTNGSKENS